MNFSRLPVDDDDTKDPKTPLTRRNFPPRLRHTRRYMHVRWQRHLAMQLQPSGILREAWVNQFLAGWGWIRESGRRGGNEVGEAAGYPGQPKSTMKVQTRTKLVPPIFWYVRAVSTPHTQSANLNLRVSSGWCNERVNRPDQLEIS